MLKHLRQYSGVNLLNFVEDILYKGVEDISYKTISRHIFKRLSSKNFIWSILEYVAPFFLIITWFLLKYNLNLPYTYLIIFVSPKKQIGYELKTKLNGKKLYQTDSVKNFGIHLYKCLTWKHQINNVAIKIKKANARVVPRKSFLSQKSDHFLLIILF